MNESTGVAQKIEELREQINSQQQCMCRCADVMDRAVHLLVCVIEDQDIDRAELREVANDAGAINAELGGP